MSDRDPERSPLADRRSFPPAPPESADFELDAEPDESAESDWSNGEIGDGLPAGFRMRHDAHFVETLTQRATARPVRLIPIDRLRRDEPPAADNLGHLIDSIRGVGVLQPLVVRPRGELFEVLDGTRRLAAAAAADLHEVPCLIEDVDDVRAYQLRQAAKVRTSAPTVPFRATTSTVMISVMAHLNESLEVIDASLERLPRPGRSLAERSAADLARAEVRRAIWLAASVGLLEKRPALTRLPVLLSDLVVDLVASLEPERRILGVAILAPADHVNVVVQADAKMLELGIGGLLRAALPLAADRDESRLEVQTWYREGGVPAFEVAISGVATGSLVADRFFDTELLDRPGGELSVVGVAVAKRVAELHGGDVEVLCDPRAGLRVRLLFGRPRER